MAGGWVVNVKMGKRRGGDGERRLEGATNRAGAGKTRTWEDTNKYLKTNLRNVVKMVGMQQITMKTALGQVPGQEKPGSENKAPQAPGQKKPGTYSGSAEVPGWKKPGTLLRGLQHRARYQGERPGTFLR